MKRSRNKGVKWATSKILLFIFLLALLITCEKPERIIEFDTLEAASEDILYTSATLKGEITDLGSKPIEQHGILLSESSVPNLGQQNTVEKPLGPARNKGVFQAQFADLKVNTTYYFRTFVVIESVPESGAIKLFTTKDTEAPTVTAGTVTELSMTSASINGEVTANGGETVILRGLCWNTEENPTISNCIDTTVNGSGTGTFSGTILDLTPGTQYYARAYATNSKGTSYNSDDIIFKTHHLPEVVNTSVTDITETSALSGGEVTDDGDVEVTSRGVCWDTSTEPIVNLETKTNDGTGTGVFTSSVTGLTKGTKYYLRAYATNRYGTTYGSDTSFTTSGAAPVVITGSATSITTTSATLEGTVNAFGNSTTVTFEYGLTTLYGTEVTADQSPVTGNTVTAVSVNISGLSNSTIYHYRIKAVNTAGTTYSDDVTFTTNSLISPTATTKQATAVASTSATLNGTVNANDLPTTITFEYGLTLSYGAQVTAYENPVTGSAETSISAGITVLDAGTTYHFRVKAENSIGITYGTDMTLITPDKVTDVDGNVYNTVVIGTQIWMKGNLKTTKFNNGSVIPLVTDGDEWFNLKTPGYCWYNNDEVFYKENYGALYNWFSVNTGNLCPEGWHVPADAEWTILEDYLIANGYNYDGTTTDNKIAKSLASTYGWILSSNTGAVGNSDYPAKRNATGFTALPGGLRRGPFDFIGNGGYWWSITEASYTNVWYRFMTYSDCVFSRTYGSKGYNGFSIRCIKDY